MANSKISALTSATTPLAGTETLPIVQSGATVKVANNDLRPKQIQSNATTGVLQIAGPTAGTTRVMTTPDANFTAARTDAAQSFTGDQTLSTGNLVQGTAAKGVNFTANTPAAGMTSQLLNWYEEGTWSPTIQGLTTTGTTTYSTQSGKYTRIGRQVTCTGVVAWTAATGTGNMVVGGLPFTATSVGASAIIGYAQIGVTNITSIAGTVVGAASYFNLYKYAAGASANITVENTGTLYFSITYFVG